MTDYAIETMSLSRRFGDIIAVDKLDLRVPQGSIYGFLGPNGSGKTTTIRMLIGLIRANEGNVQIFDLPLEKQRLAALAQIGALVELPSLYPHLTGRENLELTRRLVNVKPGHIDRVLDLVDLEADARRLVRGYSLGMRQRLALALALLREPKLLILDEPTNGLDPAGIHEMRNLIRTLPAEHGMTVFLSSHLLSEVEQMATDVGIIHAGKLLFQGPLPELQAQQGEQIVIETSQPEAAMQMLQAAGWAVTAKQDGRLVVDGHPATKAAQINATLVHAGLDVFALQHIRPSLEEMFLHFTHPAVSGKESE
ncbi:MAG TPA: ATP-binding cassette domain-containing protein [Anaerolineales bacterium]|jgi:ABC-2 type transport system ATP-binding protein|nr:ATP-binding cassette domain-containing protein [Anaerolineales bacterium]